MILTVRRPGNKTTSNLVTVQVHTMILTVRRPGNKASLRDCTGTYNDINSRPGYKTTTKLRDCTVHTMILTVRRPGNKLIPLTVCSCTGHAQ